MKFLSTINKWITKIGPYMALFAIVVALWFAHVDSSRAHELAHDQSASTCSRQIDANADATLLIDTLEGSFPELVSAPKWEHFRTEWLAHHQTTPACALAQR